MNLNLRLIRKKSNNQNVSESFQVSGHDNEVGDTEKEIPAEKIQADDHVDHLETVNVEENQDEEAELMIVE